MAFDLPIDDVTSYVEDLLNQIGDDCTIDGVATKIMISDLQRAYSNLQENSKQAVVSKDITVDRGSRISFADGRKAIVYTIPNDDIVSYSMKILMSNATIKVFRYEDVYDSNPSSKNYGDIISSAVNEKGSIDGFIERLTAREKQFDVGLLHEAILRFATYVGADIALEDLVEFKDKRYKVIDIDDITDGLLMIQLASVRK